MLVQVFQTRMLRLARGFVPSHGVAEEVVQDTWLGVVRASTAWRLVRAFPLGSSPFGEPSKETGQRERRHWTATDLDVDHVGPEHFDAGGAWAPAPEAWAEEAEDRLWRISSRYGRGPAWTISPRHRVRSCSCATWRVWTAEVCSVLGISDANHESCSTEAVHRFAAPLARGWGGDAVDAPSCSGVQGGGRADV